MSKMMMKSRERSVQNAYLRSLSFKTRFEYFSFSATPEAADSSVRELVPWETSSLSLSLIGYTVPNCVEGKGLLGPF